MTYLAVVLQGVPRGSRSGSSWPALKKHVRAHYGSDYNHSAFIRALRRGVDQGVLRNEAGRITAGSTALQLAAGSRQVGELREERLFFRARVGRRGYERGRRNAQTVLLHDVTKAGEDAMVADHAWVRCTGGFQAVAQGAHVRFCARVRVYRKSAGHDYKFFYPTHVEEVEPAA